MCGIAGFFNASPTAGQVQMAMERLTHRGPDAQQYVLKNSAGLIHTRLSIIELSSLGSQPYKFENLALVFNGEIYNYKEIRESLKKLGYSFISNSDTEVLIKAFHCWREKCMDRLIGMFAFAIYDETADEIFLVRDRVGVKPLYYAYQDKALYFASELKALDAFGLSGEINLEAASLYFRFGFIPHHLSIFKSISKLEPGHYLKVSKNGVIKRQYWNLNYETINGRREDEWLEELEPLLISAFRYRMVSDVPVGVFLSGGIDSSLLTAILQKHHGNIHSFTIGFEENEFDESVYAQQVAEYLKTSHTQKILKLDEARKLLYNFYSVYDEPFADTSGIPTACVANLAKINGVKVVLSADGGDELFGGYTHYRQALNFFNKIIRLPKDLRRALSKTTRALFPVSVRKKVNILNTEHKIYALEEILCANNPADFFESFIGNQSMDEIQLMLRHTSTGSMGFTRKDLTTLQTMMAWDFHYYLPDDLLVKVDRATMFHGVECRDPFLDHRLVELAAQIPDQLKIQNGNGKYLLRKILKKYLPERFYERKKQGFSIPIFEWFSKDLDEMFDYYLSPKKVNEVTFLDSQEIQREYKKYQYFKKAGKQYNIEKMWRILSFMLWWDKYVKHEA
jgi:asparagine synthase (glutamine-hydrolysing)